MAAKKQTETSTTADTETASGAAGIASGTVTGGEASIDNGVAAATTFDPSGAPDQIVPDVDPSHPAVDSDPRANTTADQNRIDFNDPTLSGADAVKRNLAVQSKD